jgi:hypothetical protein
MSLHIHYLAQFYSGAFATGPRLIGMTSAGGDNNSGTILTYTCGNTAIDGHISLPQGFGYIVSTVLPGSGGSGL